jgi:hypothetical protein
MAEDDTEEPSFAEIIGEELNQVVEELDEDGDVGEAAFDVFQDASEPVYEGLLDEMNERLAAWRSELDGFETRLYDTWEAPIDLLEGFIVYSRDVGLELNRAFGRQAAKEDDLLFLALQKLHARGIQIGQEILTLLKHGYADGAHARWRALHEIAAVSMFLRLSGQETAERFMLHSLIDDYHLAVAIRKHPDAFGLSYVSDEEMEELEKRREVLLDTYGKEYDGLWGWAADAVGKDRPRFTDIESAAGLEHHRPYHKFASKMNIHAGSKGAVSQLGVMKERAGMTASGPTNFGFSLPGTHTGVSIHQLTTALLAYQVDAGHRPFEAMLDMAVIGRFLDDIMEAFPAVEEEIAQREREGWAEFIEEELEGRLDEFLEEYEPEEPPTFRVDVGEEQGNGDGE